MMTVFGLTVKQNVKALPFRRGFYCPFWIALTAILLLTKTSTRRMTLLFVPQRSINQINQELKQLWD
jgi:hypothetical protein